MTSTSPTTHSFLPGAWPSDSTWSLQSLLKQPTVDHRQFFDTRPQDIPRHKEDFMHIASSELAREVAVSEQRVGASPNEPDLSPRVSLGDDESCYSDDFYSFTSSQGADETLLAPGPIYINAQPTKEILDTQPILGSSRFEGLVLYSSSDRLNSDERRAAPEDETLSTEAPSMPFLSTASIVTPHNISNDVFPSPIQTFLHSASPRPGNFSIPSSRKSDYSSRSRVSSSATAEYGDEEYYRDSIHSDGSIIDYARMWNSIQGLEAGTNSDDIGPAHSRAPSPHVQSFLPGRALEELQETRDVLFLSQPDGNTPWTLSLDPAATSPESVSISQYSTQTSSTSLASSEVEDTFTNTSRSSSSRAQSPVTPHTEQFYPPVRDEAQHRRGIEFPTSMALYEEDHELDLSQYTIRSPTADAPHSPNVMQKTKNFYTKMKKFLTPKSSKKGTLNGTSYDSNFDLVFPNSSKPQGYDRAYMDTSTRDLSSSTSTYGWSSYRRVFTKSLRPSAPSSAAISYTPGECSQDHPTSNMMSDERYTYEYHARPKTLDEIKSARTKRRFSLPMGLSGSSSLPNTLRRRNTSSRGHHRAPIPFTPENGCGYPHGHP